MAVVIEVEMVMLINQVTNTRKIQTAHPDRALTVILILIEILGSFNNYRPKGLDRPDGTAPAIACHARYNIFQGM